MTKSFYPVGHFTHGDFSPEAIILEARLILAAKYDMRSKCDQALSCFYKRCNASKTPKQLLEEWDKKNDNVL